MSNRKELTAEEITSINKKMYTPAKAKAELAAVAVIDMDDSAELEKYEKDSQIPVFNLDMRRVPVKLALKLDAYFYKEYLPGTAQMSRIMGALWGEAKSLGLSTDALPDFRTMAELNSGFVGIIYEYAEQHDGVVRGLELPEFDDLNLEDLNAIGEALAKALGESLKTGGVTKK